MPDNLSMSMILNIVFFGILGLGLLGGFVRGFKKSLYNFLTTAGFYALFFLTLDVVVNFLWNYSNPAIGQALGAIDSSLAGYSSFGEAMGPLVQTLMPGFDVGGANAELAALIVGIGQFVLKIGYTIAYFTVGFIVWKFLFWIVGLIFIQHKKGASRNPLLGAVFGVANAALSLFVLFIMLGGVVSIVGSVEQVVPLAQLAQPDDRGALYEASHSVIPLAAEDGGLADALALVDEFVTAYESNPLVQAGGMVTIGDEPLTLYLFDSVMSFTYEGETIALRKELATVTAVAGAFLGALEDAGIDITQLDGVDFAVLLGAIGSVDLTMLLDSRLISNALVVILSGEADVPGLEMIIVPDGIQWYDTLDDQGRIVEAGELRKLLTALNEIVAIAGAIDFENIDFTVVTTLSDDAIDALFDSQVLTATISVAINDMVTGEDTLVVPDSAFDENGYLRKEEMVALVHAVKLVIETVGADPENFNLAMMLELQGSDLDTLLESDILYATVGSLLAGLSGESIVVPSTAVSDTIFTVDDAPIDVVTATEIKAVFASLNVLDIVGFEAMTFDASILANLEGDVPGELSNAKIATLFGSDILRATMSRMVLDATAEAGSVLAIPYYAADGTAIREDLGGVEVITVAELGHVLKALYALNVLDFGQFDTLDASALLVKMPILLDSAILHATISNQLLSISGGILNVPYVDEDGTPIRITVGADEEATTYLAAAELEAVIGALDALTVTNPADFDGTVSLAFFTDPDTRAALLASAILRATISDQLLGLGDAILVIPAVDVDGADIIVTVGPAGHETTYIVGTELDAIFDALVLFGTGDPTDLSAADFSLSSLLDGGNLATLLTSASIHATISKQLLVTAAGTLLIPATDVDDGDAPIVIVRGFDEFVAKAEITRLLGVLGDLGLGGFDTLDFDIATLFGGAASFDDIVASASLRATISDLLLTTAESETTMTPGAADLVVPTLFREAIVINEVPAVQIDGTELARLLTALQTLGLSAYGDAMDAETINGLTGAELDVMLLSGSFHVTLHNMLLGNANVNTQVPTAAKEANLYGVAGLTKAVELRAFILAVGQLPGVDFTNAGFDFSTLAALEPTKRDIIFDSMIIRNVLTPQVETAVAAWNLLHPGDTFTLQNSDYVDNNPAGFLTEEGIERFIAHTA